MSGVETSQSLDASGVGVWESLDAPGVEVSESLDASGVEVWESLDASGVEVWESLLDEVEDELIDVEAVLADLDDLDGLHRRVRAAVDDGSIDQRPVLRSCAARIHPGSGIGV